MISTVVITGLPGTGKTHLALSLGATLAAQEVPPLVLHTDILKVTLRTLAKQAGTSTVLSGPGYSGDFHAKAAAIRPVLAAHASKARRDGYLLIVEGTLALGFHPPESLPVLLTLSDAERMARIAQKHDSARESLAESSLTAYAKALNAAASVDTLRLDASRSVAVLVGEIQQEVGSRK